MKRKTDNRRGRQSLSLNLKERQCVFKLLIEWMKQLVRGNVSSGTSSPILMIRLPEKIN